MLEMGLGKLRNREMVLCPLMAVLEGLKLMLLKVPGVVA